MGYCVFNIFNEKTAVGEDGGFLYSFETAHYR